MISITLIFIPLWTLLNSSYIFFTPLETQVQYFMYLHAYVPYLLSEFIPLCSTKTWLSVQNCITPLEGRHQFSRRKQILVEKMISRLLLFQSPSNSQVRRTGIKSWTSLNYGQFWSNTLKLHARVTVPQVSDYWAFCFTILSVFLSICLKNACIHVHVV